MSSNTALGGGDVARSRGRALAEVVLIVLVFFSHAGVLVPDVNEPQYLGKAKHYWDAGWCPGDFFLDTADAHVVFYWTLGPLTRWLSLETTAWVGRILAWSLIAWGWRRLSWALVPVPLTAVLSAALWVTFTSRLHQAGEWAVGGVEAKCFAYALVLFALENVVRNRYGRALAFFGAATAFHVVVGGWATVAAAVAWISAGRKCPPVKNLLPGLVVWAVLAAPGIVPAVALSDGVDVATATEAARIQVVERLPHHLLPASFKPEFVVRFYLLALAWLAAALYRPGGPAMRRLHRVVAAALLISTAGLILALATAHHEDLAVRILRFYWFRLADVFVPLGASLALCGIIAELRRRGAILGNLMLIAALAGGAWHLSTTTFSQIQERFPPADGPRKVARGDDWREICQRIASDEHIPNDAVFITPRGNHTFRWHTGRAEVVCWKDVPQDAASVVAWRDRFYDIHRNRSGDDRRFLRALTDLDEAELLRLGETYHARYLLTRANPRLALPRLFQSTRRFYAVYELKQPAPAHGASEDASRR